MSRGHKKHKFDYLELRRIHFQEDYLTVVVTRPFKDENGKAMIYLQGSLKIVSSLLKNLRSNMYQTEIDNF